MMRSVAHPEPVGRLNDEGGRDSRAARFRHLSAWMEGPCASALCALRGEKSSSTMGSFAWAATTSTEAAAHSRCEDWLTAKGSRSASLEQLAGPGSLGQIYLTLACDSAAIRDIDNGLRAPSIAGTLVGPLTDAVEPVAIVKECSRTLTESPVLGTAIVGPLRSISKTVRSQHPETEIYSPVGQSAPLLIRLFC